MNNTFESPLQERIQGLPPTIDKHSAVLILGTLPGQMSLTYGKYYADPSNKFWDILFIACGEEIDKSDQAKEALLRKYNIALWDILDSAVRETSSDKDLMDDEFISGHPGISTSTLQLKRQDLLKFVESTGHTPICIDLPDPGADSF